MEGKKRRIIRRPQKRDNDSDMEKETPPKENRLKTQSLSVSGSVSRPPKALLRHTTSDETLHLHPHHQEDFDVLYGDTIAASDEEDGEDLNAEELLLKYA